MTIHKLGSTMTHLLNYLNEHTTSYQKTMEQLASGNKYSSINDAPVEVSESIKLAVQIQTNKRADSNIQLGQDMLSMTEQYQEDNVSNINRIRDLCMQALNGSYTATDKDAMLNEIRARLAYMDQTANNANFDGIHLLDGSASPMNLQIGTTSNDTMNVSAAFIDSHTTALGINLPGTVTGANWTNAQINAYVNNLDTASNTLIGVCTQIGGYMNRLTSVSDTLDATNTNLSEKKSVIADADVAASSAKLVQYQIAQQASVSIYAQTNQMSSLALTLLNK